MKSQNTNARLFQIFKDIQLDSANTISHSHRYALEELLRNDPNGTIQSLYQAYLQICRALSTTKRSTEKFSQLMKELCIRLENIRDNAGGNDEGSRRHQKDLPYRTIIQFFAHMIDLFSYIALSTIKSVRLFGARTLFLIIQSIKLHEIAYYLDPKMIKTTAVCILYLLREKSVDYRKYGIKLASNLQIIESPNLKYSIENIVYEMLKIISTDINYEIRLLAVKNLVLKQSTLYKFFIRLRDKSPEIRTTVFKKLTAEKIAVDQLGLSSLYKILYDGISSREQSVKLECVHCFSCYIEPSDDSSTLEAKCLNFVKMFNTDMLLHQPHLYSSFSYLLTKVLYGMTGSNQKAFYTYIKNLCLALKKGKTPSADMIFLRVAADVPTLSPIVEYYYLNGLEQANLLTNCHVGQLYFYFVYALKLAHKFINCDETGRNKIWYVLTNCLRVPTKYSINVPNDAIEYYNDVCHRVTNEMIVELRMLTPHYHEKIIHDTDDLVGPIVSLLKAIRPEHFCNELQELLSDIRPDNEENNLVRELEMLEASIERLRKDEKDKNLQKTLEARRSALTSKVDILRQRITSLLRAILYNGSNISDEIFRTVVPLSQDNPPLHVLLRGLYGLTDLKYAKSLFTTIYRYIEPLTRELSDRHPSAYCLCIMTAIKILTDMTIKFGLVRQMKSEETAAEEFYQRLSKLLLSYDDSLRLVAIECMCRLLFNERLDNFNLNFVLILMLWWDTRTEETSAKSVHLISTFIKQFIEKSSENLRDTSSLLQIFFRTLNNIQSSKKMIDPKMLHYKVKFSVFLKKALQIAMRILQYKKTDGKLKNLVHLRRDRPNESVEIGPQEALIMFVLTYENFEQYVETTLESCDCLSETPVELLFVIKRLTEDFNSRVRLGKCRGFLAEVDGLISVKKGSEYNAKSYEDYFDRLQKIVSNEAKQVVRNLGDMGMLINDVGDDDSSDEDSLGQDESEEVSQNSREQPKRHVSRRENTRIR